jgi:hypothetical protein
MDWSLILLALIGMVQVLGLALIQRGRREDKTERKVVAAKVQETAVVAAETKEIAQSSHDLANSRYDKLEEELKKSNKHVIDLLKQLRGRRAEDDPEASGIVSADVPSNPEA